MIRVNQYRTGRGEREAGREIERSWEREIERSWERETREKLEKLGERGERSWERETREAGRERLRD